MTLTAYAANLEDVLLWRALGHVPQGRYIDTAAVHPLRDSVTALFYARGWRGLNLAPHPTAALALRKARPADITLTLAAGAQDGRTVQFAAQDGWTGFDSDHARTLAAAGKTVEQRDMEVRPLAALAGEHLDGPIHFLRIGAGDAAAAVLAGLDLQRQRPWVIVVHAAAPDPSWSQPLQAAGYTYVYSDGDNHFYLAAEHASLGAAFTAPPRVADGFVLSEEHRLAWPTAALHERVAQAELRAAEASRTTTETLTWVREWERAQELALAAAKRVPQLEAQDAHQRARIAELEFQLNGTLHSLSWRATRPLRVANRIARGALRRLRRIAGKLRQKSHGVTSRGAGFAKRVVRKLVHVVMSRPALAHLLRRIIARNPRLMTLARGVLLRTQANQHAGAAAAPTVDVSELSAAAREVLAQLQHTLHSRQP